MFRRPAPPPAPAPVDETPKPARRPRKKAKAADDAALLAELAHAGACDEVDDVAALLKALSAADAADNTEEAALMASLESSKEDEDVDAVLRQLGVRDLDAVLPLEVSNGPRRYDPAAAMVEVERLEAAVQATKRQAVECKVAGDMTAAREKLRESKSLQQLLDELMASLNTDAHTEPDLLQELERSSGPAGPPRAPLPPPAVALPAPDAQTLRDELRALKREIVALRDAGRTAEAKAGMPRLRELERRIAALVE